jgi:hypothetical protein
VLSRTVTERLFRTQYDLIFKHQLPISEIIVSPAVTGPVTIEYWGLLPFSRGNIHVQSADSAAPAAINPNYFMLDYDVQQQIATAKMARRFARTAPFAGALAEETAPGLGNVPVNASDAEWETWIKKTCKFVLSLSILVLIYFFLEFVEADNSGRSIKLPLHLHGGHDAARTGGRGGLHSHSLWYQQCARRGCLCCTVPDLWPLGFDAVCDC